MCPAIGNLLPKRLQYSSNFHCPKDGIHPISRYNSPPSEGGASLRSGALPSAASLLANNRLVLRATIMSKP
jgi:hypothetical protein